MITPVSWLERVPTYKGQIEALGANIATYGFLGYPLLQLCDIAVLRGEYVPVGRDQVAHLELRTRDRPPLQLISTATATRFSSSRSRRSRSFPKSPARRTQDEQVLRQRDSDRRRRRDDDEKGARRWSPIRRRSAAATPAARRSARSSRSGGSSIRSKLDGIAAECRSGALGCVQDKTDFAEQLNAYLRPVRERYAHVLRDDPARRAHHRRRNGAHARDRRADVARREARHEAYP